MAKQFEIELDDEMALRLAEFAKRTGSRAEIVASKLLGKEIDRTDMGGVPRAHLS